MASSLKNKLIKQQFAALTAGCFLLTNLGTPYAQATTSSSFWESRKKTSDIKKELPDFSKPLELPDSDDGDLGFRLEDGLVKERFWPGQENPGPWRVGGRTLPFIVHVQDAHRNVDAQRTLGRIVRSLAEKNGGSALVCVEGAWGELDPGLLKVFPDRELRDRAAEEFLRVGWLTGEEHLAVTADDLALRLVGVDDPLLHRANRAARDRAEPLAGLAHRRLARLADRAVRRQAALWPQSLRDLEAIRRRYEADEESLAHYVRALVSRLPPGERSGYPALDAFGRLSLLEDRYEPDRARQDLRDLAARSSALAPADRAALRAGLQAGPRERSRAISDLIRRIGGTGSAQWPALRAHAEALALRAAIDAGRLASEVESAHRRVVDDLLRQRPESQRSDLLGLLAATDWIHSRQRLWSFEMTPREWRAARRDWARYGWADVETLLGDAAPAESGDAVRAALRDAEDHLRDFYETALQRNRAMADNTLAAARRWRADRVVLITGGFHTPGLTDLLRQAGANYAVVCPVFNTRPAPPVNTATLRDQSRLEDLADRQTLAAAQWAIASDEKPVATLGEWRRSWSRALTSPTDRRWIAGLNLISRESGPDGSWTAAVGSASANDARRIQFSGTAGLRSIPLSPPPIPSISDVSAAGRQTVLKMQGGVRRAFATVKRFGRPVLQRSWPWVAAGAVLLGAAWIFLPALFPGNGAEVVFSMGSAQWAAMTGVIFPPWGRHLGVWRLDEHSRGPRDQGNNDGFDELQRLLIALEESDRRLAEAIAAKQKAEISVAQLRLSEARLNLQQFMRRRLAASDEDTATLYLRLEGPKRDLLVRAVGAQVLGRLIHGMTGHFFERARRGLRRRRADLERLLQLEESLPRASAGERERILGDLEKTLVALDRNAQGLIEGLQTFIGTPNVPDIPAPDLAKIKTEARAKLQSLADHRRLDSQWADTLRSALTTGGKTDPLPPLAAHRARHRAALTETEMDALSLSNPYIFRDPIYAHRRSRALLHGLRNREIRLIQRALTHDRATLDAVGPIYHAADLLTESLGDAVQDLTGMAQHELDRNAVPAPSMDDFPEGREVLDRVQSALERPGFYTTASLVVSSDRQKRPLLRALAHRFRSAPSDSALGYKKLLLVDLMKVFADPSRDRIVYETLTEQPDGTPGLLRLSAQAGDIVVVLDLDAFQFEDMPVLDRVLEYWAGMTRRGFTPPPLVALGSEPTLQLYVRKSKMFRDYFEAMPAFRSEAATARLLEFDADALGRRLGVAIPPALAERAYAEVQNRTPYDRHSMALRVVEAAAAMERAQSSGGSAPTLREETLDQALRELPSMENLPLEARLWSRRDVLPAEVAEEADREMRRYGSLKGNPEQPRVAEFLNNVIRFPWREKAPDLIPGARVFPGPVLAEARQKVLAAVRASLDESHSGLEEAKSEMLQYVVQILQRETGEGKKVGWNLLLVGPPGVGKTTLVRAFSRALQNRKFEVVPLGGMDDEAELAGHRRTYIGARMGKLARALLDLGISNPIIGLDEIDKLGARNGDPRAFLLQALDPEQNKDFRDRYLGPAPLDGVIFVATSNSLNIPGPLLDRFTVIHVPGYSVDEKVEIGAHHVLPRLREEMVVSSEIDIARPRALVRAVARGYTWEEGARRLVKLLRKVMLRALREWFDRGATITIDNDSLQRYLGKPWEYPSIRNEDRVGEVAVPTARGQLRFLRVGREAESSETGLIVNQTWGPATVNSARLAGDIVSHRLAGTAAEWGVSLDPGSPAGALRLDAPGGIGEDDSVKGLAFVVAMMSRRLGLPVRRDAAFAGEVDLRGRVLDVPHVRERAIAAREAGAAFLFLPSAAEPNLFQEAFKTAPYLMGPVLNLATGRLWLKERSLPARSRAAEVAAIAHWNEAIRRVAETPPGALRVQKGDRPGETMVEGSRNDLVALLASLPRLSGQLTYCLLEDPTEAVRLGLLGSGGFPVFPPPMTKSESEDTEPEAESARPRAGTISSPPSSTDEAFPPTVAAARGNPAEWLLGSAHEPLAVGPLLDDFEENGELLADALDYTLEHNTNENREKLRELLLALVYTHPVAMSDVFNTIVSEPENSDHRDFLFQEMPAEIVGVMLANHRRGLLHYVQSGAQKKARQFEEYENLLLNAVHNPPADEASRAALVKTLGAFVDAARPEVESASNAGNREGLLEPFQRLEKAVPEIQKTPLDKLADAFGSLADTILALTTFLKARSYDFAFPPMSANQREVEKIIDAHLNKLIEESGAGSFAMLTREDEKAGRVAAIWRSYLASLSVENEIQRGRLAIHNAEAITHLSPEFQATFEEATGVVRDLLDRQVFRSVNVVCPSDNTKAVFPGLLAERLKNDHRPRRVVTVEVNQFPVDPRDSLREILSLMQAAYDAGDVVLVIDLDEFRSRFGDIRARSLSRVLGRWASHRNPLPLVFLSNEETNADFTENLPVFFRWIPQHRLRIANAKVLLDYELGALEKTGVSVEPEARLWLQIKLAREEVDFALAAMLLRDGAAEAHRQHRPLTVDDLEATWVTMQSGELAARVRMLPDSARRRGMALLAQMNNAQEGSHEYGNIRDVLENLVRFPWLKRTRSPLPALAEVDPRLRADEFRRAGRQILQNARRHLDESHYGMNEAKEEIEDYLAEQIQRERHGKRGTGKVLCLVGPAGVGKSTLGESIAKALGREFGRVPLGGTRDPAEIRGHSPTYQGAMPGNIVQTLQKLQVKNPVILLDEIEKMDSGIQGNPADVLLQALDEEQNDHFTDHNIGDVDLSEVLFIATANEEDKIPEALKDRMEIVRLPAYDRAEKIAIGTDKLLPRVMRDLGVSPEQVQTPRPQELMTHLVDGYTQEPGVRELSKQLTRLVKRALTDVYLAGGRPVVLTPEAVRGYMGLPRRGATARASSEVGEAVGLVISPRGGGTINIQADARPANNPEAPIEIVNFGQLQADMLFSVETALSYLRKNAVRLGLPPAAMKGQRLLINISPGDVKKDGPSAGIGFVATIFSSLTGQPLRQDFAMTGQVDDEGKVYPIGGLKEKILAALEDRASTVILPVGNKEELIKTIFVQSPDLKGVIEENGLQRITVEQKKPAGNQTGPTAEDSTWEALNTLLTTKAQRFGLVAESDRLGALTLAGTPDQMRSFLSDSDVMKNVSYPVTYLIVSHVDEALKALRAPGNDESSGGTKPTLPLTGPALGGVLTAFLAGLAYSPESSAAPLVQSLATAGTLSFASLAPVLLLTGWMALKWIARRWNTTVLSRNTLHRMTISLGGVLADLAGKGLVGLFEFGGFLRRGPGEAPSPLGGGRFADLRDIQTMENQYPLLAAALSTAARHHWFSRGPLSLTTSVSTRALAGFTERILAAGDTRRIRYPYAARAAGAGFRPTPRTKNASDEGRGSPQRLGVLLHGVSEGLPSDLIDWRLKNMEGLNRGEWPNADSLRTLLDFLRGDSWKSPSYEGLEEERREFVRVQIVEIRRSLYARLALEAARADPLEGRKVWETGKIAGSDARVTERSSGDGWRGAADALALRPAVVHSREAIVLDAELLKAAAAEEVARLVAAGRNREGENTPLVVVVSERDSTEQLKAALPADRWGLSAQGILILGFDGLSKANAIEFAPGGRRVKMEALKSEIARQTGGGNGQAFRLTLWAASGRADVFGGDLVRLIAVEQDLLLEGAAAAAFVERLRQMFGPDEAAQMIRDLSPDGTGRVIRLPGRSPLLQETINAIQTDLLIQTNA